MHAIKFVLIECHFGGRREGVNVFFVRHRWRELLDVCLNRVHRRLISVEPCSICGAQAELVKIKKARRGLKRVGFMVTK